MKPKLKAPPPRSTRPKRKTTYFGSYALGAYTADPESSEAGRIVYYNDKFVVINDKYPKATVHLLILPRDPVKQLQMPQEAFDDPEFLADCRAEEKKVREIAAEELQRRIGSSSLSEKKRIKAMESDDPPEELPPGRDWSKEIVTGTHANPSMNHIHIHVLSTDFHSECMKKRNHYLSFTTDFLIEMKDYPLAKDDYRRRYGYFPAGMYCWRCGRDYGHFGKMKPHLDEEFEEWKKE